MTRTFVADDWRTRDQLQVKPLRDVIAAYFDSDEARGSIALERLYRAAERARRHPGLLVEIGNVRVLPTRWSRDVLSYKVQVVPGNVARVFAIVSTSPRAALACANLAAALRACGSNPDETLRTLDEQRVYRNADRAVYLLGMGAIPGSHR